MPSQVIPNSLPESREAVAAKLKLVLSHCLVDDQATYYLHGFLKGLLLGGVIGLRDSDALHEILPPIITDVLDSIPFGHIEIDVAESTLICGERFKNDTAYQFALGLANEHQYYERRGQAFQTCSICAWLGYLNAELMCNSLTQNEYVALRDLLPLLAEDPTATLAPYLQLDDLLIRRAQRTKLGSS